VGAKAEESGYKAGEILAEWFKENMATADKNGDGKLQYVMLQGEKGHNTAYIRNEYFQRALQDAGLIEGYDNLDLWETWDSDKKYLLATDTATWDKVKATDLMNAWIASIGLVRIEAVMAANDDMALGAIEALKANGYNSGDPEKYIPVVGVDATAPALEAIERGEMLGTVLNDAANQGAAAVAIANAAINGGEVSESSIGYPIDDGKYVWIPYVKVTADNCGDFL
jgi:methyl-galactoside transport system substrate-binding protein